MNEGDYNSSNSLMSGLLKTVTMKSKSRMESQLSSAIMFESQMSLNEDGKQIKDAECCHHHGHEEDVFDKDFVDKK